MEKLVAILILVIIVIAFVSFLINIYNKLVMLNKNTEKAFANIDVLLKQRVDEIPNLVTVVKKSMSYEENLLEKLTGLRTQYLKETNQDKRVMLSNEIGNALKTVFAVSENYPDLKANTSLLELQRRVSQLEDHITDRREYFNESVNMYNIGILEFPNVLFSKMLGYKEKHMLQISEAEKEYHGVQF